MSMLEEVAAAAMPPLVGVVHAAGIDQYARITDMAKDSARCERLVDLVVAPKLVVGRGSIASGAPMGSEGFLTTESGI